MLSTNGPRFATPSGRSAATEKAGDCHRTQAPRPGRPLIDAARGKTGLMERVDIGLARCRETDGDAVARWGLAVAGREDQERGLVLAVEHDVIAKRAEVRDTEWPERGIVESRRLRQIAGTETCVRKYTITGNNCHNNSPLLEIIEFFFEIGRAHV